MIKEGELCILEGSGGYGIRGDVTLERIRVTTLT